MIYSEKMRMSALIVLVALAAAAAFADDPNVNSIIGTSTNTIVFESGDVSKLFQIWNRGTGILSYKLDINGTDADYFILNKTSEESSDVNDIKNHTVSLDVDLLPIDDTKTAQIVITNDNNNLDVNYITLTALPADTNESNEPNASPVIGKNTSHIKLSGKVLSKSFKIWNKSSGTLNYTLTITGDNADYFTLDTESGQSTGINDKHTHTVSVNYDDLHNVTLTATIEIADASGNKAYIYLSATETIATRVSYVSMEQGVTNEEGNDVNDFRLYIETDSTVDEIYLTTAGGYSFLLTNEDYNESEDGNNRYWTCRPDESVDLADYGDGDYTIDVNYSDGDTTQAIINFGIPNRPGTILRPTQVPVLTYPSPDDSNTVSPVRFEWEECSDPNVNAIRLFLQKQDDDENDSNSIGREYSKETKKSSAITLVTGAWDAELDFGRWYRGENTDGIDIEVGKCSRNQSSFDIMKWFGTFGIFKNHPLKIADCSGTEVTFNLTGGGKGEITSDDCGFDSVALTGTTVKSVLSVSTKKGIKISVGDISADGDIRAIDARNVNLEGNIDITGGAGEIILNNITGNEITIGSPSSPKTVCTIKAGSIEDLALSSDTPVKSLTADEWLAGSLETPWVSTMTIKGDFDADITLSGDSNPKGMALKTAGIAGELGDATWSIDGNCGTISAASVSENFNGSITGSIVTLKAVGNKKTSISSVLSGTWEFNFAKTIAAAEISDSTITADQEPNSKTPAIGKITVTGWLQDSYISTTGNIGSITAGGMQALTMDGGIQGLDIGEVNSVGNLKIKGIKNKAYCFIDSYLTVTHFGTAYIGYPKTDNSGNTFGLTTHSIDTLTIKDSASTQTWKNLTDPNDSIIIQDLAITIE